MSTNELEMKIRELRQLQSLIDEAQPEVAARFTRTSMTRRFTVA